MAGREESYSRTRNVLKGLSLSGIEVVGVFPPSKSFRHYPALIWRAFRKSANCDAVVVGFYGQVILPFIYLLVRKPLLFDMYIATFDTMVHDRCVTGSESWLAKIFQFSDRLACKLSRRVVLETEDHINDFAVKFRIAPRKFRRVFLAADPDSIFPKRVKKSTKEFLVHFHGEYAPFHGVNVILEAAALLQDQQVQFQIVGKGITYERDRALADRLNLSNVVFFDPVPYEELTNLMARADVCLGIFGENERMLRVTTNKVIESIAAKKPLITGRNVPVQELLTHEKTVLLVDRANAQALANGILRLRDNDRLRERIAKGGYEVFRKNCTCEKLGLKFNAILKEMLQND